MGDTFQTSRRPIAEAPRDGTHLLCLTVLGRGKRSYPEWNIGYFDSEKGEWLSADGWDIDPSYFYELPAFNATRAALSERGGR